MTYTREPLAGRPLKGRPVCDVCGATERPLVSTLRDSYGGRSDVCGLCARTLAPTWWQKLRHRRRIDTVSA